ncbi:hypothetical protein LUZ62_046255 [Rhynchospora pubera]|uniref:Cytochrome P450 n=1 Tax=Rhynchospora pubera TaxID=906938 RepID=A0AAV8FTE9_9POAL|nr:hypothetical protein LUZ62_046255 [Rhynchospora pubera]
MDFTDTLTTVGPVFFLLLLIFQTICRYMHNKPQHYGPNTYPIIGCIFSFYNNRRRLLHWYTELLASSPSQTIIIQRLGARRIIVTANPINVEHIIKTNFYNYPKGKAFTEILGDLLGQGIFNVDGGMWHMQRKLISHEFTARAMRELLVTTLESEAKERLFPILESASKELLVVDMQEVLKRFTFDITCRISLGKDPESLAPTFPISRLANAFDAASAIIAARASVPVSAAWKIKRALDLGKEKQLKEEIKLIHESIMEIIHNRKNEEEAMRKKDFLSRLIASGFNDEAIRDMVISFIVAARDTTASALTWFFWCMSQNRGAEEEVLNEINVMLKGGQFEIETAKKMRVLHAALCETMRLYPPVAWDSKHPLHDDILPDGTRVKRGDRVTYFPYGMGRMKSIWGKDCSEFKLERWLSLEENSVSSNNGGIIYSGVSPFKFPIFQGGPRTCLGKDMAFVQMKFVASAVLPKFELQPLDTRLPVFVPLLTAKMANGFKVLVRKRYKENI